MLNLKEFLKVKTDFESTKNNISVWIKNVGIIINKNHHHLKEWRIDLDELKIYDSVVVIAVWEVDAREETMIYPFECLELFEHLEDLDYRPTPGEITRIYDKFQRKQTERKNESYLTSKKQQDINVVYQKFKNSDVFKAIVTASECSWDDEYFVHQAMMIPFYNAAGFPILTEIVYNVFLVFCENELSENLHYLIPRMEQFHCYLVNGEGEERNGTNIF